MIAWIIMKLTVRSAIKDIVNEDNIESVKLPGKNGEFQVLNNHISLISSLVIGCVKYLKNNKELKIKIQSGIAYVNNNNILVLV